MKTILTSFFTIAILMSSLPVFAEKGNPALESTTTKAATEAKQYVLLEPLPCIKTSTSMNCQDGEMITSVDFENYIQYIFNLVIALAAVAAVFMIVWGGFQYMTSDAWNEKSEGINKLKNAVLGLLLVLCSYLILKTVDPRLVEIPSTIVEPLKITTSHETSSFFQNIYDTASQLKANNIAFMDQINASQKLVEKMESEKAALKEQLDLDLPFEENEEILRQIDELDKNIKTLKTDIILKTVKGISNAQIQRCLGIETVSSSGFWSWFGSNYSNGLTVEDCLADMEKAKRKYEVQMQALYEFDQVQEIDDMIEEGKAIIKINGVILKNLSESPQAIAFMRSLETSITVGATIGGTIYAGPLGGAAGAGASLFINGMINDDKQRAIMNKIQNTVIPQIKTIVSQSKNNIKTAKYKEELLNNSNTILRSLGAK